MMNALVAYDDGQYDAVVDLMKPLRYDILRIGGSNAQVYYYLYHEGGVGYGLYTMRETHVTPCT